MYRDTTSGLKFEERVVLNVTGVPAHKTDFYRYLENRGINWEDYISKQILPDRAFFDEENNICRIYEIKYQNSKGSVDEKLQTAHYKIFELRKLLSPLGYDLTYKYVLCDYFKNEEYKDNIEYLKSLPQGGALFAEDLVKLGIGCILPE